MIDATDALETTLDRSARPSGSVGSIPVRQPQLASPSIAISSSNLSSDEQMDGPWIVDVLPWSELTPHHLDAWRARRFEQSESAHPFFSPRFSEAINAVRGDVLVAVLACQKGDPNSSKGFFPFHRVNGIGLPVGRFFNDAQGVIGVAPGSVDWSTLMDAADVVGFDLHAIVNAPSSWVDRYGLGTVGAFRSDFEGDSSAFLHRLEKEHRTIGKQGQKTRKLSREVGEVRLEIDCLCPEVLEQTIAWKRAQYQRTHILDLFHPQWTRDLVKHLHGPEMRADDAAIAESSRTLNFSNQPLRGMLSVLWAGPHVVAAHFGMIEQGRLHYWFPTYDPQFARYSPGTALFTEIVRAATSVGIDCIDMGYGEQPYKQKQTATTSQVAFGTITDSRLHRWRFQAEAQMVSWLKRVPMKEPIKRVWRAVHPTAGIGKLK